MTDQEKWLEENTFYCPHIKARITPDQCDLNRSRTSSKSSFLGDMVFARPHACDDCSDYVELRKDVRKTREENNMANRGVCEACKRDNVSLTGGLCGRCSKHRTAKELVKAEDGSWEWQIDPPAYIGEKDTPAEECHKIEPIPGGKNVREVGICRCCKRKMDLYPGRLCGTCYYYRSIHRLVERTKNVFSWVGTIPRYYQEAMLEGNKSFSIDTALTVEEKAFLSNVKLPEVSIGDAALQLVSTEVKNIAYTPEELQQFYPKPMGMALRGSILDKAKAIINGERQEQYGKPEDSFQRIACVWNGYANAMEWDVEFSRIDVAHLMILYKMARQIGGAGKEDNYTDMAGYTGIAADMAAEGEAC